MDDGPEQRGLDHIDDLFGRPAWQRYGACRGEDVEAFGLSAATSPQRASSAGVARYARECLSVALAEEDLVGMWVGTTAPEPGQMRERRGVA